MELEQAVKGSALSKHEERVVGQVESGRNFLLDGNRGDVGSEPIDGKDELEPRRGDRADDSRETSAGTVNTAQTPQTITPSPTLRPSSASAG